MKKNHFIFVSIKVRQNREGAWKFFDKSEPVNLGPQLTYQSTH